jgi:hypothetical protein
VLNDLQRPKKRWQRRWRESAGEMLDEQEAAWTKRVLQPLLDTVDVADVRQHDQIESLPTVVERLQVRYGHVEAQLLRRCAFVRTRDPDIRQIESRHVPALTCEVEAVPALAHRHVQGVAWL